MSPDWPSTLTEAVDRLISTMTADELTTLRDTPKDNLIMYHFSLGMYIRNEFGLWQGNDDLLASCFPDMAVVGCEHEERNRRATEACRRCVRMSCATRSCRVLDSDDVGNAPDNVVGANHTGTCSAGRVGIDARWR